MRPIKIIKYETTTNYKLVFFTLETSDAISKVKNTRNKNMKTCENYVKDVGNYKL